MENQKVVEEGFSVTFKYTEDLFARKVMKKICLADNMHAKSDGMIDTATHFKARVVLR